VQSQVEIRPARAADAPLLGRFRRALYLEASGGKAPSPRLAAESEEYFDREIIQGTGRAFIALIDGKAVGCAAVMLRPTAPRGDGARPLEARIHTVYVEPAARRRGVARRLMQEALAESAREHAYRIVLTTSKEGRPLYESLGFVPGEEMVYRPFVASEL